jgi:surface protein
LSNFNTIKVIYMSYMFYSCRKIINLDLSNFITNSLTNLNYIFYDCVSLISLNLKKFNIKNVISMKGIFDNTNEYFTIISNDKKLLNEVKNRKIVNYIF